MMNNNETMDSSTESTQKSSVNITKGALKSFLEQVEEEDNSHGEQLEKINAFITSQGGVMPVYTLLVSCLQNVSFSDSTVCNLVYPSVAESNDQEYLPELKKLNLTEASFFTDYSMEKYSADRLTKGFIVEMMFYFRKYNDKFLSLKHFYEAILKFFQIPNVEDADMRTILTKAERTTDRYRSLRKKRNPNIEQFCAEVFTIPVVRETKVGITPLMENLSLQFQAKDLQQHNAVLSTEIEQVHKEIDKKKQQVLEKSTEIRNERRMKGYYQKKVTEMSKTQEDSKDQIELLTKQLEEERRKRQESDERIERLERERKSMTSKISYYKKRTGSKPGNSDFYSRKIEQLTQEVTYWQTKYMECSEKMEEFLEDAEIKTFQNGRFNDSVREVYMELMCMRVGANNVEKIIRLVLKKMGGLVVDRLPGESFAKYMLLEARSIAMDHLKEEIQNSGNLTLGPDGTSKFGHHYGAFSVSISENESMVMGLRDMAGGDAEEYLEKFKMILDDIAASDAEKVQEFVAKMKNTVGDQASTNKKFNNLLEVWREDALPHVVSNWDSLSESDKGKLGKMNNFWCGLHFLVGLSEQANKTLGLWEDLVHNGEKVGALRIPGGYGKAGEAGTTRLVRTVCKAVQDRGCERSGKPVQFRDYVQQHGNGKKVPLAPFKGNRFNILFYNSAGVYYLLHELMCFVGQHSNDNKLFSAINADLNVNTFQAGCRALGLIAKFITGPLWRFLESNGHVLNLTSHYQLLVYRLQEWSKDASKFLTGGERLFDDEDERLLNNEIVSSLTEPCPLLDDMTKQILELIFSSFLVVCNRQLKDHLEGGRYANNSSIEFISETMTVPTTNIAPERIFGQLDYLMRLMPRATTYAIEGLTMWNSNHTAQWIDSLPDHQKLETMERARKSVKQQRIQYAARRRGVQEKRLSKTAAREESLEAKEKRLRQKKECLVREMEKNGGLLKTVDDVDKTVITLKTEKEKRSILELNIKFRHIVLGAKNTNNSLSLSSSGKKFSLQVLIDKLKGAIIMANKEASPYTGKVVGTPLSEEVLIEQKFKFQELINKENDRKYRHLEDSKAKKKRRTSSIGASTDIPSLEDPEDLVGKRVRHLYNENGKDVWFNGLVTKMKVVKGKFEYTIIYDGERKQYQFQLQDDLASGDLELIPVDAEYFVGKKIEQKFKSEDDGEEYWYTGRVLGYNNDTGMYTVEYDYDCDDDDDDDDDIETNVFEEPVLQDYANGDVRILGKA